VDEIKLFEELQPPPPPDVPRMREAARARLTAATSAPRAHPVSTRRGGVVAVAAAAALVAAGTGYGLAATRGGSSSPRGTASGPGRASGPGPATGPATTAGLTAVNGCPGMYITAGALKQVSGTRLVIQPANDTDHVNRIWRAQPVTVATSPSTAVSRPSTGTPSDITDGSQVVVTGAWSGTTLAATHVDIAAAGLPAPGSYGPRLPRHLPTLRPLKGTLGPPVAIGTVVDAHDGSFTVAEHNPIPGPLDRVQVITSQSTQVVARAGSSLSQLSLGANVVAVGQIGPDGVLTARTVAEQSGVKTLLAGGPVKIRTSGCSASAITAAAVLDGD
jgi:hypothetical protein